MSSAVSVEVFLVSLVVGCICGGLVGLIENQFGLSRWKDILLVPIAIIGAFAVLLMGVYGLQQLVRFVYWFARLTGG